jgi:pyridoxal phosphate enzyme (YggS family)
VFEDPIRRNLETVRGRIRSAQGRGRHAAAEVTLVAVVKSAPVALFPALAAAGVRDVGENRVQSAEARRPLAPSGWRWHGIGHLQRNKVARAVRLFDVFHALDSLALAERIEATPVGTERPWPVYIQVNAAADPAKGGVAPPETLDFVKALSRFQRLSPIGFMTMAKEDSTEAEARAAFRTLRELRDEVVRADVGDPPPAGLSMGMSDDFEWAVEEGATVVRVGRALFEGVGAPREARA